MALITDPDDLNDATEIVIDAVGKTIQLIQTGNLDSGGVTIKCVYSKLKDLWKSNATYIKYPFPMGPITDEQFEIINGWDWEDNTTRYLLRTGGWALKDTAGVSLEEWAGIVSLGVIDPTDQAYFQQSNNAATNFQLTGPVNQAVKIYGDVSHEDFDYRTSFKIFCRIYQKSYAFSQLSDVGVANMTYQAYRFPLANTSDAKITHTDVVVSGNAPYTEMTVTWDASGQIRTIGGIDYDFHVFINAASGTAEQVYERVQYELRKNDDMDDGAGFHSGNITTSLLQFVGDTLYTVFQPQSGVYIDNFLPADVNRLVFLDDTNTPITYPYNAVLTLNFGENLVGDADAAYWAYFTTTPSGNYGTNDAVLVEDFDGVPLSGLIGGSASMQKTFAYDTNNQGGRVGGSGVAGSADAGIWVVGIGLNSAQFVKASGLITRSTSNSLSLVAPLERNYQNV
jgi:hypothetical protein